MEKIAQVVRGQKGFSPVSEFEQLVGMTDRIPEGTMSPVVRGVDYLLGESMKKRASDIHIDPQENQVVIRYRIDGVLRKTHILPKSLQAAFISRIKIMANMDISEKRFPQDGRIKTDLAGKKVDLRISTAPTLHGEKVVLRLLDVEATSIPLGGIGFSQRVHKTIVSMLKNPQGVLFVTGPTGSGKTSTLYALINEIMSGEINIITLEDPIEYEMEGTSQIAINDKIGLGFADVLRSVLRQDPDVIMVGEIRDAETAKIAMQASLTGHLVLSTLHTTDSASAVTRLVDMGIPPYLIASSLSGVVAQRLVRVLCLQCKESYNPTPDELIGNSIIAGRDFMLHRARGCDDCDFTGFSGRIAIAELLVMDEELRSLIVAGATDSVIRAKTSENGMIPMFEDGLRKVIEGKTTLEEILKATTGNRYMPTKHQRKTDGVALRIWPGYADAHNKLGQLHEKMGDQEKAIEHFRKSLRIEPNNKLAREKLAVLLKHK